MSRKRLITSNSSQARIWSSSATVGSLTTLCNTIIDGLVCIKDEGKNEIIDTLPWESNQKCHLQNIYTEKSMYIVIANKMYADGFEVSEAEILLSKKKCFKMIKITM